MKEVVKKYEVYSFEELAEEVKEKIIEKEVEHQLDMFCEYELLDLMQEKAQELLKKYFKNKATFKNIYYNLSYSQGSGAMIEFELQYYNYNIKVKQEGFYNHERSFIFEGYISDLIDKRYNALREKIVDMNIELKKFGYSLLEDQAYFRENAIEWLSEQEFLKDGSLF